MCFAVRCCSCPSLSARRAWIEIRAWPGGDTRPASLSARRAWIEINVRSQPSKPRRVALRKESVDRNIVEIHPDGRLTWSLSARRAWIEMIGKQKSVDEIIGRSPQGERG